MKTATFFTHEESERIKTTTRSVESHTDGEVAVMVVDSSDRYLEAEILGGIILGSLLALSLTVLFFQDSLWFYILLSLLFFFPFQWLCFKIPKVKTVFIPIKRKEERVKLRAIRAFYEKGLYRTRHHTGVLLFISLLERKVWVLADKGIHKKMEQETLNQFAKMVSQGIKEDRACQALCQSIEGIGQLLAEHFPLTPGHKDELPDEVMTE